MKNLIAFYKKNKGVKPIFSKYEIFDWYDGAISGIGNLNDSDDFYLFNIVAWDLVSDVKIFSIIKIISPWLDKFKNAKNQMDSNLTLQILKQCIAEYSGVVFLLRCKKIESLEYDLIKRNSMPFKVYDNLDEIVNQTPKEMEKWFNLFT